MLLKLALQALFGAILKEAPNLLGWFERLAARSRADRDRDTKDNRNEKAIADALKAQAEKPPLP